MFKLEKATETLAVAFNNNYWSDLNFVRSSADGKNSRHYLISKVKNLYKIFVAADSTFRYYSVHRALSLLQSCSALESNLLNKDVEELSTEFK